MSAKNKKYISVFYSTSKYIYIGLSKAFNIPANYKILICSFAQPYDFAYKGSLTGSNSSV